MVLGEDVAFGIEAFHARSRDVVFTPGSQAYRLKCIALKAPVVKKSAKQSKPKGKARSGGQASVWEQRLDIRVTAMVRAGDTIFVAGSPDIVDPKDPHGAWEGRKGGVLAAFAAKDGKKLGEVKLASPPAWDGMAAARGRLYVSLQDGAVVCLGKAN